MRRISLALALIGAIAAAGCGGGAKPSSTSGAKGTAGVNFTVTLNNQGPGTVVSAPAGINCAANTTCSATFPSGTTVVLTATVAGTNYFNGWFGDCQGTSTCSLSGGADKYVVSYFSATPQAHPNWVAGHPKAGQTDLNCGLCHGNTGQGVGVAPACTTCHTASGTAHVFGGKEECLICHNKGGQNHQAAYNSFASGINPATTQFAASIVGVATSTGTKTGTYKSTVTFTLKKSGLCPDPTTLKQKAMQFQTYDATNNDFPNPSYKATADVDPDGSVSGQNTDSSSFAYGSMTLTNGSSCTYTMVKDNLPTDPLAAGNAYVYGYFGDALVPNLEGNLNPNGRHYALMNNMVSVAKVLNGTIGYTSTANVKGCERCHGAPYSKHGYRQATVAGLSDFVACKACHTDFKRGTDAGWYVLADNTAAWVAANETLTPAMKLQYAYTANLMNDTHNSHAFEFGYPQSVANCVTCHEDPANPGQMNANVLTDANFDGKVCKSCHPTTSTTDTAGRAPSFAGPMLGTALSHHTLNWVDVYDSNHNLIGPAGTVNESGTYLKCNACHAENIADGFVPGAIATTPHPGRGPMLFGMTTPVPLFKQVHTAAPGGKIKSVYAADGSKYTSTITSQITSIVLDTTAKTLTVQFSMSGLPAGATVADPTVDGNTCIPFAWYGYNSKDFVANIECVGVGTTVATITPIGPSTGPWTAVVPLNVADPAVQGDLDSLAANGSYIPATDSTKAEIGFLPMVTLSDGTQIAANGVTATIDLTTGAQVPSQYGKQIVDVAKCNKCHEALGTTFHSPSRGSAGVVACRMCHNVDVGAGHYEMQSKSIDSYVHAIHSFQYQNAGGRRAAVDFADPVQAFEYNEHISSVYPNFTIQNCESCHYAGTYDPPAQDLSLPGLTSASWALKNKSTNIPGYVAGPPVAGIPAVITGPADRACGSCHRATIINADQMADYLITWPALAPGGTPSTVTTMGLTTLNNHAATFGYRVTGTGGVSASDAELSTVIAGLKSAGLLP